MSCAARAEGDAYRHRRREDLDLQRRHRRRLLPVRAHRRGAGRARPHRPSSSFPTIPASRSPSASTSSRRIRWRRCASRTAASRRSRRLGAPGGGFKIAMQHARHFPRLRRRRGARLRAPRARRGARARARAPHVRRDARRPATDAGRARRDGDRHRRRGAADLSRRMAPRRAEAADDARSGDGEDDGDGDRRSA